MLQVMCNHIAMHGGSALIGDCGHWGERGDTFRVGIDTLDETSAEGISRFDASSHSRCREKGQETSDTRSTDG